ncbi:DUF3889 domain-containing protein [Neobacillus bataviensis]|uniref:DUF3889 domain-containing protein n=1 Tax=Neobacillus bataviensis TaxID=220685 RepID=UPI001CBD5CB2|nr:DUF3889 domain-containing protein [Neobacillus bataviensis]
MKKVLISLIVLTALFSESVNPLISSNRAAAQHKPIPPYAKWGIMAMEKTHERYPKANIVDYLHIGRVTGTKTSTEKFKLWLKDNKREFGVFIDIEFNNQTQKVIKITFRESSK